MRLGLVGATRIAVRAVVGPAGARTDVEVHAIAAGDPDRAGALAAAHGIPRVHADYAALLADPQLDAVYISTHPAAHTALALAALRAGKHALVEKPLCLGAREAHLLSLEQRRTGLVLAEAVMTAWHPWPASLAAVAAEEGLGALRGVRTEVRFPRAGRLGYRAWPELGGGVFHDVAPYWLQMLQAVRPAAGLGAAGSGCSAFDGPAGADREFSALLEYPDGVRATLDCALDGPYRASHTFDHARGTVRVRDFLLPAAGRLRLNLLVERDGSAPRVLTHAPLDLYAEQLGAFVSSVAATGSGSRTGSADHGSRQATAAAVERARCTEAVYVQALGVAGRRAAVRRPGDLLEAG